MHLWLPFIESPTKGTCSLLGSLNILSWIFLTTLKHYSNSRSRQAETLRSSVSFPKPRASEERSISLHQVYLPSEPLSHAGLDNWVLMYSVLPSKGAESPVLLHLEVLNLKTRPQQPLNLGIRQGSASASLNPHGPMWNGFDFSDQILPGRTLQFITPTQIWWAFKILRDISLYFLSIDPPYLQQGTPENVSKEAGMEYGEC